MDISSKSRSTRQWALMGFFIFGGFFTIPLTKPAHWALLGELN
jgi:hypothetical protein